MQTSETLVMLSDAPGPGIGSYRARLQRFIHVAGP
jgi:hypothetical protein